MDTVEEKILIRKRMKALRAGMDMASYRTLSMAIMTRCMDLPEFQRAGTVHVYVSSLNNEVETIGLLYRLFDEGKRVVVPVCADEPRTLRHVRIGSIEDLRPGRYGIMEPAGKAFEVIPPERIDLILAPVLAFDRTGGRLGFGGGYYDSFFAAAACPKTGLAYSFQEIPHVPREPHDRTLDIILTDKETVRTR